VISVNFFFTRKLGFIKPDHNSTVDTSLSEDHHEIVNEARKLLTAFQHHNQPGVEAPQDPADILSLIEDFRIYREELKLQHEELLKSNREIISLRDKFIKLFNLSPSPLCIIKDRGTIYQVNEAFLQLLHVYAASDLIDDSLYNYIQEEDRPKFLRFVNTLTASERGFHHQKLVLRNPKRHGTPVLIPVMVSGTSIDFDDAMPSIYLSFNDLTTREYLDELKHHN